MLSNLSVGTYRPSGSLAIVNLAWIGIPIEKVVSRWRSWGESGSSGFTCHCVIMQWVPNTNSTTNTYTSFLQYIPWQDWTRISTPGFNFKNYCTSSGFGGHLMTGKTMANPQSTHKMICLLIPNPQKKHIDRSSSIKVAKYQKLLFASYRLGSHL